MSKIRWSCHEAWREVLKKPLVWLVLMMLSSPWVHAQTNASVTAGAEKVVASSSARFDKIESPPLGEVFIRSNAKGDKHDLVFKAPDKIPDAPIEFSYAVGAAPPVKVAVTVESGASAEPTSVMLGTEQILLRESSSLITKEKAVLGQVAVRSAGDPKKYDLVYVAPKDGAGKKDEVSYSIADKDYKVTVGLRENLWGTGYEAAFKVLFATFVVAVVLELGLSVLFNWRYFLRWFDAAGVKTVVSVGVAYWFVRVLDLDVLAKLVNAVWLSSFSSDGVSRFISALVLAGGSATVNTLMVSLGFRSVRTAESVQRKPLPTDAWLAVMVSGATARRAEIRLLNTAAEAAAPAVGAAGGAAPPVPYELVHRLNRLWPEWAWRLPFVRNPGRFPGWGGYVLAPGTEYILSIQGLDTQGNEVGQPTRVGPFKPARGAIIDIQAVL